jgi:hypothetical protein
MQLRIGIAIFCFITAGAALTGCASGSAAGGQHASAEDQCLAAADTEEERSNCTFENQKREQGGRGFGSEAE